MILAIDTCASQCAVALVAGDIVWRRAQVMARGHAEALFPMIDEVLAEAGAEFAGIARIAVCTGPGSFTGIRAGVAAARGLALGLGVPAVGVTRLAALAAGAGHDGPISVILPTRGAEVARQDFAAGGLPEGEARLSADAAPTQGHVLAGRTPGGPEPLPDPVVIARLAARAEPGARPAPLYLRSADAAPSRIVPPPILP